MQPRSRGERAAGRDAGEQPLNIVNLPERFTKLIGDVGVCDKLIDRFDSRIDCCDIGQRRRQPIGQQPSAQASDRAVEHSEQRAFPPAVAQGGDQFQAAARGGVNRQPIARRIRHELVDMGERSFLGLLQIIEHRAGSAQCGNIGSRLRIETETFE